MRRIETVTVTAGTSQTMLVLDSFRHSLSVVVKPGSGGTATVHSSNTKDAASNPGAANWVDSGEGSISTLKEVARFSPCVALKFTAVTADATFEVVL